MKRIKEEKDNKKTSTLLIGVIHAYQHYQVYREKINLPTSDAPKRAKER